jgi:DNA polymerase III subunit delta
MVAVKSSPEAYLKSPPKGINAILLFGPDAGLVTERAQALAKAVAAQTNPPGDIFRLDDSDLENDPDKITVELTTVSMFGGRRIVRASQSRRVTAASLKPLLDDGRLEGFLIIEAGALKAEDGMRKLFEQSSSAAAIPCYADEARDLEGLIKEVLARHKLDITPDAKRLLLSRLGADRGVSRMEVDKLALYALGSPEITEADVAAIVGDASDMTIDAIISAAATGKGSAAVTECDRALAAGESAQYVMIAAQRHLQRLHRVRMALEAGASMDEALKGLRPPVFYNQRGAFVAQVELWSAAKLIRALARITEAQRLARSGGELGALDEAVLTEGLLLDIARLAAFKGRG